MPSIAMKTFIAFAILITVWISPSANAQSTELEEIQAISTYTLEMQNYTIEMASYFEDPDFTVLMDTVLGEEEFNSVQTMELFRQWRNRTNEKMDNLESRLAVRSDRPELHHFKSMSGAMETIEQSIDEMFSKSKLTVNQTETFLQRAIKGDLEGIDKIRAIQIESLISLINTEILVSKSSANSLSGDHPQHHLINCTVHSNEFVAAELDIKLDIFDDKTSWDDRKKTVKRMKAIQKRYRNSIEDGLAASQIYEKMMLSALEQSKDQEQIEIAKIGAKMMKMYPMIFENERAIYRLNNEIITVLEDKGDFALIEADVDQLIEKYTDLLNNRIALDQEKTLLAQQMQ